MIKKHTYLNKFCEFVSNPIPFILVNGELSVCCRDYDGSLIMGDTKDSIEAILNNERFKDLQHSHSNVNSNSFQIIISVIVVLELMREFHQHLLI